jgi:hypothetical protein
MEVLALTGNEVCVIGGHHRVISFLRVEGECRDQLAGATSVAGRSPAMLMVITVTPQKGKEIIRQE